MNHDPWNVNSRHSRFSKFLPELLKDKIVQCAVLLLFIISIDWQLSERMNEQQYYFMYLYLWAHMTLFIGFDPTGYITVGFHDGSAEVTRIGIATHPYFASTWSRFCDSVTRGFGIALFFIVLAVAYSIANKSLEKWAHKEQQALEKVKRQIAFEKQQEAYRLEKSKPKPATPTKPIETDARKEFETPPVELLTELIEQPEENPSVQKPKPEKQSKEPPVSKPLRLPGRIYRDEE